MSSSIFSALPNSPTATTVMSDRQPRRWTSAEDQILREQVDAQHTRDVGRDWCQVAMALPGRTNKDCRKRWHNSVTEGLKKGQWSMSEDQLLTRGVHQYGPQWTKVATCVNTRSADQCAKRWQHSLNPFLDRSEWREYEDAALLAAVERLGRHWKDIQEQCLPHRSKNCIKNRYSVLARRDATQLMLYENSFEGSSSDPGTPLQLEPGFSINYTPTPSAHINMRTVCPQSYQLYVSGEGTSSDWTNFNDPHNTLAADHPASFGIASMPAYPAVEPSHALYSNSSQWDYMQSTMSMHQPVPFPAALPLQFQSYTYPLQQQQLVPSTAQLTPSTIQATNAYPPVADQPIRSSHRGRYCQ